MSRADNTTVYSDIVSVLNGSSTESQLQSLVRKAGTFSNLFCSVSTNTTLVNTTVTLRKSTVDTSVTVTYGSGETGIKEDTTNSSSFANTDEVTYKFVVANDTSGATTITFFCCGIQFEASSDTAFLFAQSSIANFSTDSVTRYLYASGTGASGALTTENSANYRCRSAFTSSNFFVNISNNARTTNTTYSTRKNDADANQNVTFGSTEIGLKEDTTNTDSLAIGDDYNYRFTTSTGGGNIQFQLIGSSMVNTSNIFALLATRSQALAINLTRYSHSASDSFYSATEANKQYYPRFDFTAKEFIAYVSANTVTTSATTVHLRDNGANSSITVSFAAAETGLKNDSTNSTTITSATDEIDYRIVTPNTSGSITFQQFGILGETAAAASNFVPKVMMM